MRKSRTSYTPQEKLEIILDIMSKKTSIQNVAKERSIAPTLISLWKRQAEEAMLERFHAKPRGRRPKVQDPAEHKPELRKLKNDARSARIKATHLENSVTELKLRLETIQQQMSEMAKALGCRLVKERRAKHEEE